MVQLNLLFKTIRMNGTRKRLDKGDIKAAKDYAEQQAKDIDEVQAKVEEEQLELFPDDPRIQKRLMKFLKQRKAQLELVE